MLIKKSSSKKNKFLLLGWHEIGKILIREYADYLVSNSVISIAIKDPSDAIKRELKLLFKEYGSLKIKLINADPLKFDQLNKLNPYQFDNVIILAQDESELSFEKIDSDTLIILLLLRRISKEKGKGEKATKIITQVLNSENQDLIIQTDVDDFIISNKLVTMVLA